MAEYHNLLALYDCRSKQEYIYRTNRVQEITGASLLLQDLFKGFFEETEEFDIRTDWEEQTAPENFLEYFNQSGKDAEIIYEGGGNLCIIYKDEDTYIRVNRALSYYVIQKTFSVSVIASAVPVTGDFVEDRKNLYLQNTIRKNTGSYSVPCNVLPFTQVDRLTYQPIVKKEGDKQYTSESQKKMEKYQASKKDTSYVLKDMFDKMTDKGNDSILAIIYIDGNNMGNKVKAATENKTDYADGINALRAFSKKTNADFVKNPITAITNRLEELYRTDKKNQHQYRFRQIIAGGDEITIVCSAHAVVEILDTYFATLLSFDGEEKNSACAGVALFHSHAPFADVYRIAEACCESGKGYSHLKGNETKNYIDFHFCHAGIMNDMETIREQQEMAFTARPYEYESTWKEFLEYGEILKKMKRSDVKALGEAIAKGGDSYYREELERIKSRDKKGLLEKIYSHPEDEKKKKMIFDISIIYDLWFPKKGLKHEQN